MKFCTTRTISLTNFVWAMWSKTKNSKWLLHIICTIVLLWPYTYNILYRIKPCPRHNGTSLLLYYQHTLLFIYKYIRYNNVLNKIFCLNLNIYIYIYISRTGWIKAAQSCITFIYTIDGHNLASTFTVLSK